MYINKPSVTKIEAVDRVNFCIILAAGSNSTNLENLVKCLHLSPKRLLLSDIEIKHWIDFKTTLHVASGSS